MDDGKCTKKNVHQIVLDTLRVQCYHPAKISKNNLGFLAGMHH